MRVALGLGFNPQPGFHPAEAWINQECLVGPGTVSIHSRAFTRPKPRPVHADVHRHPGFNPQPGFHPAEAVEYDLIFLTVEVSIHSRAYTRPNRGLQDRTMAEAWFQSTAGLSPGRSVSCAVSLPISICFNPQPGFHPAEAPDPAPTAPPTEVSIHSRAFTRPKLPPHLRLNYQCDRRAKPRTMPKGIERPDEQRSRSTYPTDLPPGWSSAEGPSFCHSFTFAPRRRAAHQGHAKYPDQAPVLPSSVPPAGDKSAGCPPDHRSPLSPAPGTFRTRCRPIGTRTPTTARVGQNPHIPWPRGGVGAGPRASWSPHRS